MSKIIEVDLNTDYLIGREKDKLDFWDVFQLESGCLTIIPEPKDMMIAFFKSFPETFMWLLRLREWIARRLKLKTAPETDEKSRLEKLHNFKGNIGESIAVFDVLERSERELVTGQKDSHLDFKLAFISYREADRIVMQMATTVIINNVVGKMYFAIVKPIHKYYMRKIFKRMEMTLLNKDWE
ncbi:DUF2867 domain-containing protein [bacterium SCSIO 12643]|nr:DUF2867 domain-containing protein [bacterium SCSIO 12643]